MTEEITDTVQQQTGEVQQQNEPKAKALALNPVNFGGARAVGMFSGTDAFVQGQRMAVCLASSTMIPDAYRQWTQDKNGNWQENPSAIGNCMIAVEIANRMNVPPLAIMQNMDVVKGRPGFRGSFVAGLVNDSPLFGRMRYEFSGEGKEYGCRAYATDAETGEVLYGTKITWAMVTGEGWDKNAKWNTMRDQMFTYRAASFWVRAHAPDLLLGNLHSAEELEDVEPRLIGDHRSVGALNERLRKAPETELAADATNQQEPAEDKPGTATTPRKRKAREPLAQAAAEPEKAPDGIDAGAVGEPATDQAEPAADPAPDAAADTSFYVE